MNHKSSWAEEERAPSKEQAMAEESGERAPRRIIVGAPKATSSSSQNIPMDVLIVASKLKLYIKEKHDLNTSAEVIDTLSDIVRRVCDDAVISARQDGRKTLMSRDF
jgi:histone H3/H4